MINAERAATQPSHDRWTVTTKDRSLSAQWEHMVAVTNDGFELLTRRGRTAPAHTPRLSRAVSRAAALKQCGS